MARKFIIQDDQFIMGSVGYHFELKLPNGKGRVEGGGYWHVDRQQKIIYLYASSTEFGAVSRERLQEVVSTCLMDPYLNGYKVLHAYVTKFPDAEETDWEELHVIDLKPMMGTPDGMTEDRSMLDYKITEGGRALMNDMRPRKTVPVRTEPKIGRNEPCPCGSGKKYKKCCIK